MELRKSSSATPPRDLFRQWDGISAFLRALEAFRRRRRRRRGVVAVWLVDVSIKDI